MIILLLRTIRLQIIVSRIIFIGFLSNKAIADVTKITLLQSQLTLSYQQEVRFSQVLSDAYAQSDYDVYTLGTALIVPNKQPTVEAKKQGILHQLKQLNTAEASNLAKQLETLRFAYHEQIATDLIKVRVKPKLNPMIKGEYWLSLPARPKNIMILHPSMTSSIKIAFKANSHIKNYLSELPNDRTYDSAWIIQANRDVYKATDIQWKNRLYFLSPGAIVFTGLQNLPDKYRDLNADIAHLLAFRLEP